MSAEEKLARIAELCDEAERVWAHNATSSDFQIPPFDRHGVRQLRAILEDRVLATAPRCTCEAKNDAATWHWSNCAIFPWVKAVPR